MDARLDCAKVLRYLVPIHIGTSMWLGSNALLLQSNVSQQTIALSRAVIIACLVLTASTLNCCHFCLTSFADVPAEAQGHVPTNANTRNYVALTGPPVGEDVWQTFPEQLKYCTTGWQPLKDLPL